jgi:predicted transcriptional regulator
LPRPARLNNATQEATKEGTTVNYIVDSVDSALKLLSHVAEHPGLGVTELANQLGINKSRAYRMLCTLELHRPTRSVRRPS